MAVSRDYLAYVVDQLATFDRVVAKRMFGGYGLYAQELFFALIADDTLYFKVNDATREDYVARGAPPFRPFADDPDSYSMNYYQVPADVLDDPDELARWARKALDVARTAQSKKNLRAPRSSRSKGRGGAKGHGRKR